MRGAVACVALAACLCLSVVAATSAGPVRVPFGRVVSIVLGGAGPAHAGSERDVLVVQQIRLPRVLVAMLVGATLGVSGAVMQALFRNPLADPGIVGVSSGAAMGAVVALSSGLAASGRWAVPIAAFAGAVASLTAVSLIAAASARRSAATLLLAGLAMNALLGALISALVANAPNDPQLRSIVFWLQGGLDARTWAHAQLIVVPAVLAVAIACVHGRDLNVLLLGDEQARGAGVHVERVRALLLLGASLGTAAAVAVSGIIGFVGLIVPHAVRLTLGPDHRVLLPASALAGASFLVLADLVARMLVSPAVLQVGTVTALAGAPVFLLLVLRSQKEGIA